MRSEMKLYLPRRYVPHRVATVQNPIQRVGTPPMARLMLANAMASMQPLTLPDAPSVTLAPISSTFETSQSTEQQESQPSEPQIDQPDDAQANQSMQMPVISSNEMQAHQSMQPSIIPPNEMQAIQSEQTPANDDDDTISVVNPDEPNVSTITGERFHSLN